MATFGIIDLHNLFFRAQHVAQGDAYTKAGMAMHIMFKSFRKLHREMKVDHFVICSDNRSWRYDVYPEYKRKRKLDRLNKTESEQHEAEVLQSVFSDFTKYLSEQTRCTFLDHYGVEGDDFVARWIQLHPNDQHVLLSGDSDFIQLLAPNVKIVDGVQERTIAVDGVTNFLGDPMIFSVDPAKGKLKVGKTISEAKKLFDKEEAKKAKAGGFAPEAFKFEIEDEWWRKALFIKIIRGDPGDGIFPSFPGVRYEGTKKKTGIKDAWEDRNSGGYHWNNLMLSSWDKVVGEQNGNRIIKSVKVRDEYHFNESLIDLTKQPEDVKNTMDAAILQQIEKPTVNNVGINFMKFCKMQSLPLLSKEAKDHAVYLNAGYPHE